MQQSSNEQQAGTVLIVDDDASIVAALTSMLTSAGFSVLTADSGRIALETAAKEEPDLILLDVRLPEMDGFEVLQQLKENPATRDIPVIVVSISEDRKTGFALGATGYISKPVNRDALISEISRIDGPVPDTVMIVDDNEIDRKEMTQIVEDEGIRTIVADSGRKCLDIVAEALPDVLVLDLMMPEMDGFEVLEKVRNMPEARDLPVIIVTAKDLTPEDRERLSGNVFSILSKRATTSKNLLEEIKKILSGIKYHAPVKRPVPSRRILLVEDNEAAIIQVKAMLESEGYLVDAARGGREALDYVKDNVPDGIILDLMMPEVDGFEVLEKIRGREETAKIPVLVLTAKDLTRKDMKKLSANNIQQLIQKGDVDREGLLFKTKLMLGVEAGAGNLGVENRNLKLETQKPGTEQRETSAGKPATGKTETRKLKLETQKFSTGEPETRNSQPATILVVEDNPDNMATMKALLHGRYNLIEATDGEEGLRKALEESPDLVLLDIALPGMDGYEVAGKIREKGADIAIIAVTARAMKGDREAILDAGFDDYVSKPVDPEEIIEKIEKWVR